jgi:hypothetical protein
MATTLSSQPMSLALKDLLNRVRGEYAEMPGLTLTLAQAQRLWGLDRNQCDGILCALADAGFLRRTARGYIRCGESV